MDIKEIFDFIYDYCGTWGIFISLAALLVLSVQIWFWAGRYRRIATYKAQALNSEGEDNAGISVIVPIGEDNYFIDQVLPKLLRQEYTDFEIVVVEVGTGEDYSDLLNAYKSEFPQLTTTRIDQDPRFPISNKMAYNVGIKAARYENIILTTPESYPVSAKWLRAMARGFAGNGVVIGYCGIEELKGFPTKIMRCGRLKASVEYLSAAIRGRVYRGIIHNVGFTKSLYFANRGFDHLNMNLGEGDLFIRKIAQGHRSGVVMSPQGTVRQHPWGGLGWWLRTCGFNCSTVRYYPARATGGIAADLFTSGIFTLLIPAAWLSLRWELAAGVTALYAIRMGMIRYYTWRIRRRLGEKGLGWTYTLYDIFDPWARMILAVSARVKPSPGVWR